MPECRTVSFITYVDEGGSGGGGGSGNNPDDIGGGGGGITPPTGPTQCNPTPLLDNGLLPCPRGNTDGWMPILELEPTFMLDNLNDLLGNTLTPDQLTWLNNNSDKAQRIYIYLTNSTLSPDEKKEIAQQHLDKMMTDPAYLAFVNGHDAGSTGNAVWWEDDTWLDNPNNINFDIDPNGTNQYDKLNAAEKSLVKKYPISAIIIKGNRTIAENETTFLFGANGLNDKSDAFRHAFFNAMNRKDIGLTLFGVNVSKLFSDAHETSTPLQLQKEKEMDLFNNDVGNSVGTISFPTPPASVSNNDLMNIIITKLNLGELKYLRPLNFTISPYYDANNDGVQDCPTCLDGMYANTQLVFTNQ